MVGSLTAMARTPSSFASRASKSLALTLAVSLATAALPRDARADEVPPTAKGIVGGALLGAEVVTITEGLIGVKPAWAYLVGGGLGAAAGGVGGYFVEQSVSDGVVPVAMLAGGLALVVPAIVISLNGMRYELDDNVRDKPVPVTPAADPGKTGGSAVEGVPTGGSPTGTPPVPAPATDPAAPPATTPPAPAPAPGGAAPTPTQAPTSLFDVRSSGFRLGVPVPEVRPVLSLAEQKRLGVVSNTSEVRLPVLHVSF